MTDMLNQELFNKGVEIIEKRRAYNNKYYLEHKKETQGGNGRKHKEINNNYIMEILEKRKIKNNKNKLETEEQIKKAMDKLIIKLKEMREKANNKLNELEAVN